MRIFKSVLVSLIGLTALMYALQNLADIGEMRRQIGPLPSAAGSPAISWTAFALITLCRFVTAAVALKGAWDLFAARRGTADEFREARD